MPGTVISPLHTSILETGTLLGYFSDNPIGCCNGFTLKWLSACLVGEEAKFNQRVKTILNDEHLIENINRVKEKIKHGEEASQEDKDYFEILEFYEGMLLFQSPNEHPELLGSRISQYDFELMSPLASSDKMNELGGLVTVHSDIGFYTKEGIENYLNNLAKKIDDTNYDSVDPIGFHLVNHNHAVGLTYNKTTHQWTFKDTNNAASLLNQDLLTTKEISREIFNGFKPAPSEELIESMLDGLPKNLNSGESSIGSSITYNGKTAELRYQRKPEKWTLNGKPITKQDAVQGVYRIFHGEKSLSPYNGETAVYWAAKNGFAQTVFQLAEKSADLNIPSSTGKTPTWVAAYQGHLNVIQELFKYQANLDTPTNDGATPLFVAAQNGHTEIVKFLLTNSQSHSIAFISTTESLKKFAQSRGENVIQRMHEMLELKLSSGADKDHISLLPQEIAWIMDHQEVMQAFRITRPEMSSRLSVGSTDPRWKAVNTSFSQLFASEKYKELLESQKEDPLKKEGSDPNNQDPSNRGHLDI